MADHSLTKQRADYIRCIARTHADSKGTAWCGRAIDSFSFVDIDHAAENGVQEGRLVACPECVAAVRTALSNGHADEKHRGATNREMLRELSRLADRCTKTTDEAYDEALVALLKKVGEIPEHLARVAAEPKPGHAQLIGTLRVVSDLIDHALATTPSAAKEILAHAHEAIGTTLRGVAEPNKAVQAGAEDCMYGCDGRTP